MRSFVFARPLIISLTAVGLAAGLGAQSSTTARGERVPASIRRASSSAESISADRPASPGSIRAWLP